MRREVERARREDPECLFAFRRKHGEFSAGEIRALTGKHRLEWTRSFGTAYLGGGRGLAPAGGTGEP